MNELFKNRHLKITNESLLKAPKLLAQNDWDETSLKDESCLELITCRGFFLNYLN